MSQLTLTPHDRWRSSRCSLDCVCQNGTWLVPCTDPMCDVPGGYLTGKFPADYRMPAIPLEVMQPWYWDVEIDAWNACHVIIIEVTKRWADGSFTGPMVYQYPAD